MREGERCIWWGESGSRSGIASQPPAQQIAIDPRSPAVMTIAVTMTIGYGRPVCHALKHLNNGRLALSVSPPLGRRHVLQCYL